ncbi:amidohydrolase/deacetylase family metallohydrolase [Brassicibacter mesophilus]|uniref:amidohydrolase/deacetylase family metallohydrolase n=1 Tax=Brassicibacter mesophilus TaxID=745119 RepID=UPI003D1AF966
MTNSILIKGGKLLDISSGYNFTRKDICINNGLITEIEDDISSVESINTIYLDDEIVAPGFIDIHTHVYKGTALGVEPDEVGIKRGVTTIFDAGSSGPKNFEDFFSKNIKDSTTSVFSLLNIAYNGLENLRYELSDMNNIRVDKVKEIVNIRKDYIKGIKARASATTVGELGIKPIELAKKVASDLKLPLVVHIGNYPPYIDDVLDILDKGDVVTHCYHGKANGLLDEKGDLKKSTQNAIKRGVCFDIGHGTSSFNFNTAKKAISQGFYPDIISTDIYKDNINGPVYSLETTINKLIGLGIDIDSALSKVTAVPADIFKLQGYGRIEKGFLGDLTIFSIKDEVKILTDSDGNSIETNKHIKTSHVIKSGEIFEIEYN